MNYIFYYFYLRQAFKPRKIISPALFEEITQYQLNILSKEAAFFQQVVRYFSAFNSNTILILIQIICYDYIYQQFGVEEEDICNFLVQSNEQLYFSHFLLDYKSKIIDELLLAKKQVLKKILALDKTLIGEQDIFKLTFTFNELIEGLKSKQFKRIGFLLGAGASVSAGIPEQKDFRSKDGLYNQLHKYNLEYPEQIFSIHYFVENPQPFYKFCQDFKFLDDNYKPAITHQFLKLLDKRGQLSHVFTQNIDGLELKAGINKNKVIQAHGNMEQAHCISCNTEAPIEDFKQAVQTETILKCKKCDSLVKPDIIFFGQQLPGDFFVKSQELIKCDLIFIIGTSLAVYPFASLVSELPETIPIVLINKENESKLNRQNFLFYQGNIDEKVQEIISQI